MWLQSINLGDYVDIFKKNNINGTNINDITDEDLKQEFGIQSYGHRNNFKKAVK